MAASSSPRERAIGGRGTTCCWREGCTLKMKNGRDHAGVCNVVIALPRRRARVCLAERVCLVDERLPDDMLVLVGSHLSAPSLLAAEQCSHRFLDALRAAKVWTETEPRIPARTPTRTPTRTAARTPTPTLTQGPAVARAAGSAARARDCSSSPQPRIGASRPPAALPPAARRARRARLGQPGRPPGWRDERVVAVHCRRGARRRGAAERARAIRRVRGHGGRGVACHVRPPTRRRRRGGAAQRCLREHAAVCGRGGRGVCQAHRRPPGSPVGGERRGGDRGRLRYSSGCRRVGAMARRPLLPR
eukprot:scaffold29954_cov80-Phaeocystis_antarctica.AAC.4